MNTLFLNSCKVLIKEPRRSEIILESNNIVNHVMHGLDLVIFHGSINRWSVEKLVWIVLLSYFVPIENWIFISKVIVIVFSNNAVNWFTIKCKNTGQVCPVKLQEWLKEDGWSRLLLNQTQNLGLSWTFFKTLNQQKLSKCDNMNINVIHFVKVMFSFSIYLNLNQLFNVDKFLSFICSVPFNNVFIVNF